MLQRLPPREIVRKAGYSAKVGATVEIADLERYFAVNGYHRASTVSEQGEFAVRGGVIDVFPPGAEEPFRLDLFGDTLESIRGFDRETQRSTKQHHAVDLLPVSEVLLDKSEVHTFRQGYLANFGAPGDDPLYATVSEGGRRAGMEHWLPLFYGGLETLFDYLPDNALIGIDNLATEARNERLDLIHDAFDARETTERKTHYRALAPDRLYLAAEEWDARLAMRPARRFSPFQGEPGPATLDLGAKLGRVFASERAQDSVNLFEATADHARELAKAGKRVIFASWSEGSSDRLGVMLADHGLKGISLASYWQAAKAADPKKPQRAVLPLGERLRDRQPGGDLRNRHPGRSPGAAQTQAPRRQLPRRGDGPDPGDLVVHIDHGIGRYEGLKTLEVMEAPHDCLELHYGGEAKLYLPVENIDLLTRYGAESEGVQLDRLGGAAWQARKSKAKERLRVMAEGLIAIAAQRATHHVEDIEPPAGMFDEFCARFPL